MRVVFIILRNNVTLRAKTNKCLTDKIQAFSVINNDNNGNNVIMIYYLTFREVKTNTTLHLIFIESGLKKHEIMSNTHILLSY